MGLIKGEVKLEQYDLKWEEDFQQEAGKLYNLFGEVAKDIQHIGSTSVRGLSSKPIIDIAVGVNSLSDFAKVRQKFIDAPEYSVKENGDPTEILVRKHATENHDEITHFIHVMEIGGNRYKDAILFRDTLRSNPKMRLEYESLKRDLAKQYPHDRASYTQSKDYFIRSMLREARHEKAPRSNVDKFRTMGLFIGALAAEAMFLLMTLPVIIGKINTGFEFRQWGSDSFFSNFIMYAPLMAVVMVCDAILMGSALKSRMMPIFWLALLFFATALPLVLLT